MRMQVRVSSGNACARWTSWTHLQHLSARDLPSSNALHARRRQRRRDGLRPAGPQCPLHAHPIFVEAFLSRNIHGYLPYQVLELFGPLPAQNMANLSPAQELGGTSGPHK